MSKFSRNKGKRFEREVVHLFRAHGFDAHRSAQYKGNTDQAADIEGVPFIHIEAKHQERMRLYEWVQQSVTDAEAEGEDKLPTVIHKGNNNSDMIYTYGTATHTCKSLICTKEEHSHTGNSSSGGGCYGGRNYSSGTDYTNCPLYSKLRGAEHRSHDSSCVYTYNTSGVTYHCDKNSVYSNDVLNGTIKVRIVPGDPFTYGGRYITLSTPDRRGYTFKGWFGDNGFTEENPSTDNISIDAANAGNKTYTAKWELNKYKITTELHGGKTDKEIPAEYTVESEDIILPEPKRKGMRFYGWKEK